MTFQSIRTNGAAAVAEMNLKTHILPRERKPLLAAVSSVAWNSRTRRGGGPAHGHAGSTADSASFLGGKATLRAGKVCEAGAAPALPHSTRGPFSPATRRTCLPRAGPCCRRGQSHGACWTGRGRGLRVQTWVSSCKENSGRPCLSPCCLLGASP